MQPNRKSKRRANKEFISTLRGEMNGMNGMNSKECLLLGIILAMTVASIFFYQRLLCYTKHADRMTIGLLPEPFTNISDGWAISHILLYMVLGYLFPTHLSILFCIGVFWEIMEASYGWLINNTKLNLNVCIVPVFSDDLKIWWIGRWHDIISNSIGLAIGYGLHKVYS